MQKRFEKVYIFESLWIAVTGWRWIGLDLGIKKRANLIWKFGNRFVCLYCCWLRNLELKIGD